MKKHLCTLLLLALTLVTPFVTRGQSLEYYTFTTGTDTTLWIDIPSTDTSLITPGAGDYGVSSVQSLGFGFSLGEEVFGFHTDIDIGLHKPIQFLECKF